MKRTAYTLLAALCCCLSAPAAHAQAPVYWNGGADKNLTGTGSADAPLLISTADQLAGLAERVNGGEDFEGKHIRLVADLYLSDPSLPSSEKTQWTPISGIFYDQQGAWEWTSDTLRFRGNFDGGGHTIYNLYYNQAPDFGGIDIDNPSSDIKLDFSGWNKGLFGYVEGGTISNLRLENDTIIGAVAIGGIAAYNVGGTISNCSMTGFVGSVESGPCGGIVGQNTNGIIEHCTANATSKGTRSAGVLAGSNTGAQAVIRDCQAQGQCYVTQYRAGGFCGSQFDGALIERCSASVEVSNAAYQYAAFDCAGFVSNNDGIIRECYSTGNVTSPKSAAGFVACNVGRIESCYCTGNVTVGGYGCTAAAFVGENGNGSVSYGEVVGDFPGITVNCFATGACTRADEYAALHGFLASYWNESPNSTRTVFCSYNSTANPNLGTHERTLGGAMAKTTSELQSQAFVDTLNMVAAWMGTSTWTYRPGQYPVPTGVKASNLTDYIGGGDGTKDNPYIISNKEHLTNLATMSNLGWDFRDQYILQTADIDLNRPQEEWGEEMPTEWIPIGQGANRNNMDEDNANVFTFRGHYDGGYHEVRNMYINSHYDQLGFFGVLNHGATIRNLGITNAWAKTTTGNIGLLASCSSRYSRNVNIAQCWTSGRVESTGWAVGGILGQIALEGNTNILNCASSAHITGTVHVSAVVGDQNYIGGEAYSNDTIANFIFSGTFDKEGYRVPMMENERLFNALFDSDVYRLSDSEEQVALYGGQPTAYLQSKELANIFNYWIDQWNATHDLQLDYYNRHEGQYLATESGFTPPYKVTFDSEGGSALTSQSILQGSKIDAPAIPTYTDKVFAGWYTDEAHTQVFDFSTLLDGDITLHAKWLDSYTYDLKPFQNPFATSYIIKTKEQLLGLAVMTAGIEGVQDATDFTGKTVKLGDDILLNDTTDWKMWGKDVYAIPFPAIGQYYTSTFNGTFDGQGHTISGLYQRIDNLDEYSNYSGIEQGLFGNLGSEAKVSNVRINASVLLRTGDCTDSNTYGYMGLLAGKNKGQVSDCHVDGYVETYNYSDVGGLIGQNWGAVTNCSSRGSVISHDKGSEMGVGGLIGYNELANDTDTLRDCSSSATVEGRTNVGGLIGNNARGVLSGCQATGDVRSNGNAGYNIGGLAGRASNIVNSHAEGSVTAPESNRVGGLAGQCKAQKPIVMNCQATGAVTGKADVGGLIGIANGDYNTEVAVSRCMASGQVTATGDFAGGLIGHIGSTIATECYAEGNVQGTSSAGGLIGGGFGTISNCYARGSVTGSGTYLAGLIGGEYFCNTYCCHATGTVTGPEGNTFGLRSKGYPTSSDNGNYYDRETTGQSDDALDSPRTTEEMHRMATFVGWDFGKVWGRRADTNDGYPYLRWTVKETLPNDTDIPLGISSTTASRQQGARKVLRNGEVLIETPQGRAYRTDGKEIR